MGQSNFHFTQLQKNFGSNEFNDSLKAFKSLREEHSDYLGVSEIKAKYTINEVSVAFNPVEVTDILSPEEKIRRIEILDIYYELNLPKPIQHTLLNEEYTIGNSPFTLSTLNTDELGEKTLLEDSGDESLFSELEARIVKKQEEFLNKNLDLAAEMFGFEYQKMLNRCLETKNNNQDCYERVETYFQEFLNFVAKEFNNLDFNYSMTAIFTYSDFLPLKDFVITSGGFEIFDSRLMKVNPGEYKHILEIIVNLLKHYPTLQRYNTWFEYYKDNLKMN